MAKTLLLDHKHDYDSFVRYYKRTILAKIGEQKTMLAKADFVKQMTTEAAAKFVNDNRRGGSFNLFEGYETDELVEAAEALYVTYQADWKIGHPETPDLKDPPKPDPKDPPKPKSGAITLEAVIEFVSTADMASMHKLGRAVDERKDFLKKELEDARKAALDTAKLDGYMDCHDCKQHLVPISSKICEFCGKDHK